MKMLVVIISLFGAIGAFADNYSCPQLFSAENTDAQIIEAEKQTIQTHSAALSSIFIIGKCEAKFENIVNANASRKGVGDGGHIQTTSGVETTNIYSCDVKTANGSRTGFIKIRRFTPLEDTATDSFAILNGFFCKEIGAGDLNVLVEFSLISKK
jgi:hypothetical protein